MEKGQFVWASTVLAKSVGILLASFCNNMHAFCIENGRCWRIVRSSVGLGRKGVGSW